MLGERWKPEMRPSLYYKMEDVQILYEGFEKRLHEGYVASEELLEVLADNVEKSRILKGAVLALDGFTGFTPIQMKLLEKLLKVTEKVYLTVTIDILGGALPGRSHALNCFI